ncbi:MAG TPA: hypothetical protein P5556_06810 [Candidatus Gastranaerophilales bacterium]|nr:hypothetical protein [Candidatus Gastranaerophilales bacterium]
MKRSKIVLALAAMFFVAFATTGCLNKKAEVAPQPAEQAVEEQQVSETEAAPAEEVAPAEEAAAPAEAPATEAAPAEAAAPAAQ